MKSKTAVIALFIAAIMALMPFESLPVHAAGVNAGSAEKEAAIQNMEKSMKALTSTTRYAGTDGNAQAKKTIAEAFKGYGYEPTEQEFDLNDLSAKAIKTANVVAVKKAELSNPDILVVSAHYDSMPGTTGAVDDASGVAMVLSLAQAVAVAKTDTEIRFVCFSGEEEVSKGSEYYVSTLSDSEKQRMIGDIQLDMLGHANGETIKVCTVDGNPTLLGQMIQENGKSDFDNAFEIIKEARSDHAQFSFAGIPGTLIEEEYDGFENHTPADNIQTVDVQNLWLPYKVVYDTLSGIMADESTDLSSEARKISDYSNLTYAFSRESVFYFGESKALTDLKCGGSGVLTQTWHDDETDYDMEKYRYNAVWFGMDRPIETDFLYRVLDNDRYLINIELRYGDAGYSDVEMANALTQALGKPDNSDGTDDWYNSIYQKNVLLDKDKKVADIYSAYDPNGTIIQQYNIANGISQYKDDVGNSYRLLQLVHKIIGDSKYVDGVTAWTDGISYNLGKTYLTGESQNASTMQLDVMDIFNDDGTYRDYPKAVRTITHEFFHALSINSDQIDFAKKTDEDYYYKPECFRQGSYLLSFYDKFWKDINSDTGDVQWETNPEMFADQYASQTCDEDIAESFMLFVLCDKQIEGTIAQQKINFFYDYPELVQLRTQIRENLGID